MSRITCVHCDTKTPAGICPDCFAEQVKPLKDLMTLALGPAREAVSSSREPDEEVQS